MTVFRRYFEVTDDSAIQAAREINRRIAEQDERAKSLAKEFGFTSAVIGRWSTGRRELTGFSVTDIDAETLKREWKVVGQNGDGSTVYAPKRSLRIGKQRSERMKEVVTINEQLGLKRVLELDDFPDVLGPIGSVGFGRHFAAAQFLDGEAPVILVSLPFDKVDAEVPASLASAREITEHQYVAHFDRVNAARKAREAA